MAIELGDIRTSTATQGSRHSGLHKVLYCEPHKPCIHNTFGHSKEVVADIADKQFGFTAGKGTSDAILTARNIIQKVASSKKQDNDQVWFLFIDFTKAFDSVYHDALWHTLTEFRVPKHLTWLGYLTPCDICCCYGTQLHTTIANVTRRQITKPSIPHRRSIILH